MNASSEFWLSIAGMVFGVIVVGCVFIFGRHIFWSRYDWSRYDKIEYFLHELSRVANKNTRVFHEIVEEYLGQRNKFWEMFGQVTLSVVVVVLLTVLLLMEKIQADAGLPILSAIVAFVVGKGIGGRDRGGSFGGPGADDG